MGAAGNPDNSLPFPPEVAWIRTTLKRNELEDPEILSDKEAEAMVAAAKNPRDRALIEVAYEGGFRVGELPRDGAGVGRKLILSMDGVLSNPAD